MKSFKTLGSIFYLCAAALYALAIICFLKDDTESLGIIWLVLGSAFLCLASVLRLRHENDGKNEEEKK